MMKIRKGITCLIFAAWCLATVFGGSLAQSKKPTKAERVEQGRALFLANCVRCHGDDGMSKTQLGEMLKARDLTDAKWQSKRSDSRLRASISRGREAMPAFIDKLSKDEIAALVAYVRTLKKSRP